MGIESLGRPTEEIKIKELTVEKESSKPDIYNPEGTFSDQEIFQIAYDIQEYGHQEGAWDIAAMLAMLTKLTDSKGFEQIHLPDELKTNLLKMIKQHLEQPSNVTDMISARMLIALKVLYPEVTKDFLEEKSSVFEKFKRNINPSKFDYLLYATTIKILWPEKFNAIISDETDKMLFLDQMDKDIEHYFSEKNYPEYINCLFRHGNAFNI